MKQIKRFEPLSVMKIAAICYALLGLMEGLLFSVMFFVPGLLGDGPQGLRMLLGGLCIVVFPILFAALGAAFGGLGAVVYNVSARYVGGIKVEVEQEPEPVAGTL